MNHFDVKNSLSTVQILVDTREQDMAAFRKRLAAMKVPYIRRKLDFGDYGISCMIPYENPSELILDVVVERKMSLGELCNCFCQGRDRFIREFERAKAAGAKVYLLVENATWEKIYAGSYNSRMQPQALSASITAWLARYNCQIIFCKSESSGRLIKDILYRELKEKLEGMGDNDTA